MWFFTDHEIKQRTSDLVKTESNKTLWTGLAPDKYCTGNVPVCYVCVGLCGGRLLRKKFAVFNLVKAVN